MRLAFVFSLALLALGSPTAEAAAASSATGSARAVVVRIVAPGGGETVAAASAPPAASAQVAGYVSRNGAVTLAEATAAASAVGGERRRSAATATATSVSLFAGEITVGALRLRASARASGEAAESNVAASSLDDVQVFGEAVPVAPNVRIPLADWGYVVLLEQGLVRESGTRHGRRTFVTGLHVHLTAEHGGLPAGTEIAIGFAEAAASAPKEKPKPEPPPAPVDQAEEHENAPPPPRKAPDAPPAAPPPDPKPQPPGSRPEPPPVVQAPPPGVKPKVTGDYVFPVYGAASFTDDFGAARAHVGWHHGNDVFAPLGAPILAVADGTVFRVGWNEIGGNRLWLRDDSGNQFYYAHLSAFSPLAVAGRRVEAGDVLGFVGSTGDAVGTPPHLHFEIHPAGLLGLGYDGVVNPYEYLLAWRRRGDASFDLGPVTGRAPPAGAILLQADDISTTSGLDPETLARELEVAAFFGDGIALGGVRGAPSRSSVDP